MQMRTGTILASAIILLATACSKDGFRDNTVEIPAGQGTTVLDEGTVPGVMTIKVTEELAERLLGDTGNDGEVGMEGLAALKMPGIEITRASTAFFIGGKFEARQRAAGLHRWFNIYYRDNVPLSKASSEAFSVPGIEKVEPVMRIEKKSVSMNDPLYQRQWHYHNTGQYGFTPGIDIRLQEAWDTYGIFGNNSVTVAVIDDGVNFSHEDLAWNMWVNEAELNGTEGTDDDGNGYVDDIYGYNFIAPDGKLSPQDHGTHVAGTVAAVNNNGIGVCGVAGGRYPEKGVRIMALQIMDSRYPTTASDIRKVFQYAAENGANIAQNSWGYEISPTTMVEADKVAIDYFVANAGTDENGMQTGPMKGGLAIFAAGNSSTDVSFPPAYDKVLSVAATGPTGEAAYYTNYGDWVDICAPGGDSETDAEYGMIVSTYPGNLYAGMEGTSMACPHVSGVAALALSEMGGPGFTADRLFKLLVNTANPDIYRYNEDMRGYRGQCCCRIPGTVGISNNADDRRKEGH